MRLLILILALGMAAGGLTGCGSGNSVAPTSSEITGTPEDRAAIEAEAARYPEFMDDGVYASSEPMSSQIRRSPGVFATQAAIDPITFFRRIRERERHFEVAFADTDSTGRATTAILTITKELSGTFNILAADTSGGFNEPVVIKKDLAEVWTRRLLFERTPKHGDDEDDGDDKGDDKDDDGDDDDGDHVGVGQGGDHRDGGHKKGGRWRLVGVSGVEIHSQDNTTDIVSLRFEGTDLDTTITDPLEIVKLDDIPLAEAGSEVTITATTNAADDIVLLVSKERRFRLEANGDNTYSGTFVVPASVTCGHFGVSALSNDTLFDDEAPYDSETWLQPVRAGTGGFANR